MNFHRHLIGDRTFYREVTTLVIPMVIQNTVTNVVSLLDNLMVGAIGTIPMAAVTIINQLMFVYNLCVFGGLSGVSIFSTQYAGAKNNDGVRHCFRLKLCIVVGIFLVTTAVFLLFPHPLINCFLKGDATPAEMEETVKNCQDYLTIMLFNLLPFALSMTYASTLRELGETRIPMIASVIAILTNLVFNYFLIFGKCGFPELGVSGAALATVLSRFVELAIIMLYTHVRHQTYPFIERIYKSLFIPRDLLKATWKRGTPLLLNELCWAGGMTVLLQCFSLRGLHVIAACNIVMTSVNLFNCVFYSLGHAVAVIIGHILGANQLAQAKPTAWKLISLSVAVSVVMATLLCLCAPFIPKFYNTGADVHNLATRMLWISASGVPFLAFNHASYFTIRAGGRGLITFMLDSGFTWLFLLPITWYIGNYTTMHIIPFFFIARWTEAVKMLIAFALVKSGIWIRRIIA